MRQIKDRVAVVTGAGTGIGFLIAEALIVNGAFGISSVQAHN